MEMGDISQTFVPSFDSVSDKTYSRLSEVCFRTEFLELQSPMIREVDTIWAEELFADSGTLELNKARKLLEYTANRRDS